MVRKRKDPFRKKINKPIQKKLVGAFMIAILAFAVLVIRVTYINASKGEEYTKVVLDQQQYDSRVIPFKRGDITDRNGTKLASSERVYNVILDVKAMLDDEKATEPTIQVLKECFEIQEDRVRELIEDKPTSRYEILKKNVDYNTARKFQEIDKDDENYPNVKGIWLEEDYIRTYPYETLACDVIGFTSDGNVGTNGIEASYNSILNGTDGREYGYQDESASLERTVKEPESGNTVVSTIDLQVQSVVEKYVLEFNEEHKNRQYGCDGDESPEWGDPGGSFLPQL